MTATKSDQSLKKKKSVCWWGLKLPQCLGRWQLPPFSFTKCSAQLQRALAKHQNWWWKRKKKKRQMQIYLLSQWPKLWHLPGWLLIRNRAAWAADWSRGGDRSEWSEVLQGPAAPFLLKMALFFTGNRDAALCGILISSAPPTKWTFETYQKTWDWLNFNNHLYEFSQTERSQPPRTSPRLSVFADCSLSDTCAHRAFLSLPAGSWRHHLHAKTFWKKYLQTSTSFIVFHLAKTERRAGVQHATHTKSPAVAD